jgi:UDP-glucuronate decarboxylase
MITKLWSGVYTGAYKDLVDNSFGFTADNVCDVRHLVDKAGNSASDFRKAIDGALDIYRRRGSVLITCDMGISRSRVVAIGLLSAIGLPFPEALSKVLAGSGNAEINLELITDLAKALNASIPIAGREPKLTIVGASGFVGSALSNYFQERNQNVETISRGDVDVQNESVKLLSLLSSSQSKNVILCTQPRSFHSPSAMGSHLTILKNVLEACRLSRKRLIYISSMIVYAGNACISGLPFLAHELGKPVPKGCYSESKYLAEQLSSIYRISHDVEVNVVRTCGLYGPGMKSTWMIPKFVQAAKEGKEILTHIYLNGRPQLEMLHISDFCNAIWSLVDCKSCPSVLNVGSHKLIGTDEIAQVIVKAVGSSSITKLHNVDNYAVNIVSDIGYIDKELGWSPTIGIEQGISDLITQEGHHLL